MKDSLEKFEDLNKRIDKVFEAFDWLNPKKWLNPQSKDNNTSSIDRHLQSIESGDECAPGQSNKRFVSPLGKYDASFYSIKRIAGKNILAKTGTVKDIKPFLDNAGISKRILRCYDLQKDKLRIAWLFNGEFDADILDWDPKKKKVIFQGKWHKGIFGGINSAKPTEQILSPLEKMYYVVVSGHEIGPFSAENILKSYQKNKVNGDTVIRPDNSADYQHIKDDKVLSFLIKSMPTKPSKAPVVAKKRNLNLGK